MHSAVRQASAGRLSGGRKESEVPPSTRWSTWEDPSGGEGGVPEHPVIAPARVMTTATEVALKKLVPFMANKCRCCHIVIPTKVGIFPCKYVVATKDPESILNQVQHDIVQDDIPILSS